MMHEPDWYNVSLKVFLKNNQGEILCLKHSSKDRKMAGFYDFPGGRIDPEEFKTPYENIIKRELTEEIGSGVKYNLSLTPVSFARHHFFSRRRSKEVRILLLYFEGKYLGGDIKISPEHSGYKWLDLKKIKLEDYFIGCSLEAVRRYLALGVF